MIKTRYTNEDLNLMDPLDVYKLILSKKVSRFPKGFWDGVNGRKNAEKCVKYLIEELLELSETEMLEKISGAFFTRYKLRGMVSIIFDGSPFKVIDFIYPGKYFEWQLAQVPNGFWTKDKARESVVWLFNEKLKYTDEDIKKNLTVKLFQENGLTSMLNYFYDNSPSAAVQDAFPGRINEWEMINPPRGYWNADNCIKAIKWLFEDKLKYSKNEIIENLSYEIFEKNGLGSMVRYCYNSSPLAAIEEAYPGLIDKPWLLKRVPRNYWNEETGVMATKWLLKEKLRLKESEIIKSVSYNLFLENGLDSMLKYCFDGSLDKAIKVTFPELFAK